MERYTVFRIPKRSGGFRIIEAPNEELKQRQRELLPKLRRAFKVSPFAHAFEPYRNIVTMALPHVGKRFVGRLDIENFFPSITAQMFGERVCAWKPLLKPGPGSPREQAGPLFAPEDFNWRDFVRDCFLLDPKLQPPPLHGPIKPWPFYRLPQGAPTSPFLANAYLYSFDWLMAKLSHKVNADYSRYADDIALSGEEKSAIRWLFRQAARALEQRGLRVNWKKARITGRGSRQVVCGVVVNEKINLPREWRKRLRAEVHQKQLDLGELPPETLGRLAYEKMVRESEKTTSSSREIIRSMEVADAL